MDPWFNQHAVMGLWDSKLNALVVMRQHTPVDTVTGSKLMSHDLFPKFLE